MTKKKKKQEAIQDGLMARMLSDVPDGIWSGVCAIPKIGDIVNVDVNDIGPSEVLGYWLEAGYVGCVVRPSEPPEWYVRQNGSGAACVVFGIEIYASTEDYKKLIAKRKEFQA